MLDIVTSQRSGGSSRPARGPRLRADGRRQPSVVRPGPSLTPAVCPGSAGRVPHSRAFMEVPIWLSRSNLLDIGPPRWTGATKAEGKGDGKDREGPS